MNVILLSFLLILISGFFQGTFGLGMKRFSPVWEAYWFLFAVVGMIIIPFIWARVAFSGLWDAIGSLTPGEAGLTMVFGLFWGTTALMFGISIKYLGVSLAYGIAMGVSAAVGSLVPLFRVSGFMEQPSTPFILIGNAVLLAGVYLITHAGQVREKMQSEDIREKAMIKGGRFFRIGLFLAIISGIGAAALNIGFVSAEPAVQAAIRMGAKPQDASLVAWVVVLAGGFLASFFYCIYLFVKNKSLKVFSDSSERKSILKWSLFTALLWFAALGLYGQGAALMGQMGPVIGWSMFMAIALIVSNLWGIYSGEWRGATKPMKILIAGDVVLLVSWVIMGYANSLM